MGVVSVSGEPDERVCRGVDMRDHMSTVLLGLALAVLLTLMAPGSAPVFTDVPAGHAYESAINDDRGHARDRPQDFDYYPLHWSLGKHTGGCGRDC